MSAAKTETRAEYIPTEIEKTTLAHLFAEAGFSEVEKSMLLRFTKLLESEDEGSSTLLFRVLAKTFRSGRVFQSVDSPIIEAEMAKEAAQ